MNYCVALVPFLGLSINEVFELPICEMLYFTCMKIDTTERERELLRKNMIRR